MIVANHHHRRHADVDDETIESCRHAEVVDAERVHHLLEALTVCGDAHGAFAHHGHLHDLRVARQPLRRLERHACGGPGIGQRRDRYRIARILQHLDVFADQRADVQVLRP